MGKNKKKSNYLNYLIILISAIIVVLLCYSIFHKEKTIIFNITKENIEVKFGEKKKIEYEISNDELVIEWSSNNDNVIVNSDGELVANKYGTSIITGVIKTDEETISDTCVVSSYNGEIGVKIEDITVPEGYLLMKSNSEYEIPFNIVPSNAYVSSIDYYYTNENIVIVDNGKIIAKNVGETILSIIVNKQMTNKILIKVVNDIKENGFFKLIDSIILDENNIVLEIGSTKLLSYDISPRNSYIDYVEWTSSDEDIVTVDEGNITGVNVGEATIKLKVNDVYTTANVKVQASKADIKIDYNPKTVIRIGESTTIKASINPANVNYSVTYKSSNPSVVSVNNGVITGLSSGVANVTLSIGNGKSKTYTIYVLAKNGNVSGNGNLWGYKSLNAKTPILANQAFFQKLAANGIGIFQNGLYVINSAGIKYTYDINASLLQVNGKSIKVRIYYPQGEDLSTLNTLTYMGGRGETNFGGAFADLNKNPSIMKSAGILTLVAEGNNTSFDGDSGAYATLFTKAITKQKENVKNSILGFSDGAHKVMHASNKMKYDKIIVFSGYTDGVNNLNNAKNSEVFFIIATRDGNYSQAQSALRHMKESGYTNVTVISNGSDMAKLFSDKFLVINPGSSMKNGHLTENVLLSGIIEYAND